MEGGKDGKHQDEGYMLTCAIQEQSITILKWFSVAISSGFWCILGKNFTSLISRTTIACSDVPLQQ